LTARSFDEKFVEGLAFEISCLSNQLDEWQSGLEADPVDATGSHEGNKDFL